MSQHETIIIDSDEDTAPLAPAVVATSGGVIKPTGAVPLVPEAAASQESGPAAVPVLAAAVPVPTATVPVPVASVPVPAANVQSGRRRRPGRPSIQPGEPGTTTCGDCGDGGRWWRIFYPRPDWFDVGRWGWERLVRRQLDWQNVVVGLSPPTLPTTLSNSGQHFLCYCSVFPSFPLFAYANVFRRFMYQLTL